MTPDQMFVRIAWQAAMQARDAAGETADETGIVPADLAYLLKGERSTWQPHQWVVEAVKAAYLHGQSVNSKFRERALQMSDDNGKPFADEADSFLVDAAFQRGFEIADDDATVLMVHEADFVSFVREVERHAVEKAKAEFETHKKNEGENSLSPLENSAVSENPWPFSPVVALLREIAAADVAGPRLPIVSWQDQAEKLLATIPQALPNTPAHAIAATVLHKAMEYAYIHREAVYNDPEEKLQQHATQVKRELKELIDASVLPPTDERQAMMLTAVEGYFEGAEQQIMRASVASVLENHASTVRIWKGRAPEDEVIRVAVDINAQATLWDRVSLDSELQTDGDNQTVIFTLTRKNKESLNG